MKKQWMKIPIGRVWSVQDDGSVAGTAQVREYKGYDDLEVRNDAIRSAVDRCRPEMRCLRRV